MMKRIAIVTPCILPVPATEGGAVEELITRIISDNELNNEITLDVFSVLDVNDGDEELVKTNVISIEYTKGLRFADRILDKIHRTTNNHNSYRLFDKKIADAFEERLSTLDEPYYAVIVENQISIAKKVASVSRGIHEFPIFFHMHNDVDIYRSPEGIRDLAAMGVQFIAVSKYIEHQILGCAENAVVHLLYNGTDLSEDKAGRILNKREATDGKVHFLYAGRVIPEKGVLELVEAFSKLLNMVDVSNRADYCLDIIGFSFNPTKYENKVTALANTLKSNISCKKRVPTADMSHLYEKYDVVVMPTMNEEPFGLVALETMSKGLALITTNSGALPEVVGDGACIVDRDRDFTTKLAEEMLKLAINPADREALGKRAYERAREVFDFDIRNYYSNFLKIIDKNSFDDKITIVVPVYNVSLYLRRCVQSLVGQTYACIEILLIDDGSTDDSGKICDELAESDPRIKVVHQKNMGLSGARNTGLDNATGKFVFFCDSDDFLQEDALEYMHDKLCRDNADIVACGISQVFDDYNENGREVVFTSGKPGAWSGSEASVQMMSNNNICTVAWNKLYKKELFDGIRFPIGVLHEDEATTYKLLFNAKLVSYTPKRFYKYFQRSEGIMGAGLSGRYDDMIRALRDRIVFYEENGDARLAQYSRVSLLEHIKYCYRNVEDSQDKINLIGLYKENICWDNAPKVLGMKKRFALLLWKYIRY